MRIFFLAPERVPRKPLRYFDTLKHSLLSSLVLTEQDRQNGCGTSREQAVKDRLQFHHLSSEIQCSSTEVTSLCFSSHSLTWLFMKTYLFITHLQNMTANVLALAKGVSS